MSTYPWGITQVRLPETLFTVMLSNPCLVMSARLTCVQILTVSSPTLIFTLPTASTIKVRTWNFPLHFCMMLQILHANTYGLRADAG